MARIKGNGRDNSIRGGNGSDDIYAKDGDDYVEARGGNDYVDGGNGDDWIDGGDGNDTLKGGSGKDVLIGGAGSDQLYGGSGDDILLGDGLPGYAGASGSGSGSRGRRGSGSGSRGRGSWCGSGSGSGDVSYNDYLDGGSGNDILLGQLGNDTLKGGSGNDYLDGGVGTDSVDGEDGHDTGVFVVGENGGGTDWYDGGKGCDTLVVSMTSAQFNNPGIRSDLQALQAFIEANANAWTDNGDKLTLSNLGLKVQDWESVKFFVDGEEVELALDPLFTQNPDGVDFDDVEAGTYLDGTQYDALESDDVVSLASSEAEAAQAGYDTSRMFSAGAGDDTVTGRGLDDTIEGNEGDDTLDGGAGDDTIYGDNSDDTGTPGATYFASGNAAAWAGAGVTLSALDFGGSAGTVTYDGDGVGVSGGNPVGNQINHSSDGTSETLVAQFDDPATEATVTVSRMYATESGGEQGAWAAYDASGNLVGQGTFGPEITGGGNVGSFTISGIGEFSEIRFTGREYANGTAPGANDSSDYYVKSIAYTTAGSEPTDGGDDVIVGGTGDDTLYGQGGNDIIDGDAPSGITIRTVENNDGCFDIGGACEITISVDYLSSFAGYNNSFGYYLAGSDGVPTSGSVIFANVKTGGDGVGDVVTITLDANDLSGGEKLGFFIIPNGSDKNAGLSDGDDVTFAGSGGSWQVLKDGTPLDGQGADVLFSNEDLNPGSYDHEGNSWTEGNMNWEDIVHGGDRDYNDANFNVSVEGAYFGSGMTYEEPAHASGSSSGHGSGGWWSKWKKGSGSGSGRRGSGSGKRGSGSGSGSGHHHGSGSGTGDVVSFNDYLDGGAGDDILDGNLGADIVYGNDGNDIGEFIVGEYGGLDQYDGGTGTDTLRIFLTSEQYNDPAFQAELVALKAFIQANSNAATDTGASMTFTKLDLRVEDWEELEIYVDGKIVDDGDNAADAEDDSANASEDGPSVVIDVLANDDVPDGVASVSIVSGPASGTATVNPDNTITYDPAGDFDYLAEGETATVTFTYEVEDTDGDTDIATVTVTVSGTNDAPVVQDVSTSATEDGPAVAGAFDGDDPDSDDDGSTLTYTVTSTPSEGLVTNNGDGTFSFDPGSDFQDLAAGETRDVTFDYTATDSHGAVSNSGTVTVTVTGTNDDPYVVMSGTDDSGSVTELADGDSGENSADLTADGSIEFDDADLSDGHSVSSTANGTGYLGSFNATIASSAAGAGTGSVDWTFTVNDSALDSLNEGDTLTQSYDVTVDDGNGGTATQTVTIIIEGTNDAPVISGDVSGTVTEDAPANTVSGQLNADDVDNGATEAWTVVGGGAGTYGTLTVDGTGQWTYTLDNSNPLLDDLDTGETATETFTIEVQDDNGATDTQTVTITINGNTDNNFVLAADDSASVGEDGPAIEIDVLANDSAPDGVASVTIVSGPAEGSATVNPDNSISFDPGTDFDDLAAGETRDVTFTYEVEDTDGDTATATVTVTVTGTNDTPQVIVSGTDASGSVTELPDGDAGENTADLSASGTIEFDDADLTDTHTASATANGTGYVGTFTAVVSGAATGAGTGTVDWDFTVNDGALDSLNEGEILTQSYDVTIDDGNGGTAVQTVTVTIEGTNDAPVVQDVTVTGVEEDGAAVTDSFDGDDADSEDDASTLTYTITSSPSEGSVTNNNDGTFTFDPGADFQDLAPGETRDVTFEYTATDAQGAVSNTGTVTVTVSGTNDAPVVQDVATSAEEDGAPVTGSFDGDDLDNDDDGSTLTYTLTSTPSEGSVTNNGDGTFSFDPGSDFQDLTDGETRDVTFTYEATDSHGAVSNSGTVTVTVTGTNDAPVVQDVATSVDEDGPAIIDAFDGDDPDSDDDGTTLTYTLTSVPAAGAVINNGDGTFSFDPNGDFESLSAGETQDVTFTYEATDSHGAVSNSATVTVTVNGQNDDPDAQDDAFTTTEDIVLAGNVLADNGNGADSDVDNGDTISVVENTITTAEGGTVTMSSNGSFSYTPPEHFSGTDTFVYTIEDGQGGQDTATATISVVPDADVPDITVVEPARGNPGDPIPLDITIDFPDQDGSEVHTITISGVPEDATLNNGTRNPDGSWSLSPADLSGLTITTGFGAPVFPGTFELSDLQNINGGDGSDGFILNGMLGGIASGFDVASAGDVNGNGFADILTSAILGDPSGVTNAGYVYLHFGAAGNDGEINLNVTDPEFTGYRFDGIETDDRAGASVSSAGDVNNDGFDDIFIGVHKANPDGNDSGQGFIIFGSAGNANLADLDDDDGVADGIIKLSELLAANGGDGTKGFVLNGSPETPATSNEFTGYSLGGGIDFNGDGIDDVYIGARGNDWFRDLNNNGTKQVNEVKIDIGATYVVYGSNSGFAAEMDLRDLMDANGDGNSQGIGDGSQGIVIRGINTSDQSGFQVSGVQDVNSDGFDELLIGARQADPNGGNSGQAYLVFGFDTTGTPELDLSTLDGTNGYVFNGVSVNDRFGRSVSDAGDLNGDGINDFIFGAYNDDDGGSDAGQAYVVFGDAANLAALDAQDGSADGTIEMSELFAANGGDGTNGFVLTGGAAGDTAGWYVRGAGDINGDGIQDVIIGAPRADANASNSGTSYVVFGKTTGFDAEIDLDAIAAGDGSEGFALNGIGFNHFSGWSVNAAGDVNGDGIDDLVIGAYGADGARGDTYVLYGRQTPLSNEDFNLVIEATATETGNGDSETSTDTLFVDINEAPTVPDYTFAVVENSANGTYVGTSLGTDPDAGDTLDYAIVGGTGVGVFAIDISTGNITVADQSQLDHEDNPVYTLIIEVTDDFGLTDTNTVTINVQDVFENSLVDAVDDAIAIGEDSAAVNIAVLANDDAPDGVTSLTIVSGPAEGTATVNPDNTITFNPGSDFQDMVAGESRDVTFTYEVTDPQGDSDTATVTVTVNGTNDTPVVQNVAISATEDGPAVGGAFVGDDADADDDGSTLTYTVTSGPAEGSVINNGDGTFSFDPGAGFQDLGVGETRNVTFEYEATDSHGATSNTGTVTVTVTGQNDGPVANDDNFSVSEFSSVSGNLFADNGNGIDFDIDGDIIRVVDNFPQPGPLQGEYDAATDTWTLTYQGATAIQTITLTQAQITDLVTWQNLSTTFPDNPDFIPATIIDLSGGTDIDADGTDGSEVILGGTGSSHIEGRGGDDLIFGGEPSADPSPLLDFDDFLYAGLGNDILVGGAGYDVFYIRRDGGDNFIIDGNTEVGTYSNGLVLFEGFDENGDIIYTDELGNDHGVTATDVQFVNNNDGTWTINFTTSTGTVTFASSEISDINLQNNQPGGGGGTVVIYKFDDNGTPTDYTDDRYVSLTAGARNGDGGAGVIQTANGGYASVRKDGTFTYHAPDNFDGVDSFDYTVTDPYGQTDTATVYITVSNTNNTPTVENVSIAATEDGPAVSGAFVGDDIDTEDDGSTLTYTVTTGPAEGAVTNNGDGTFSFDPGADFQDLADGETRDVTFDYTATDSHGAVSDTGTVTVTVTGTNDAPVASDDYFIVARNTSAYGNLFADNGSGPDVDIDGDTIEVVDLFAQPGPIEGDYDAATDTWTLTYQGATAVQTVTLTQAEIIDLSTWQDLSVTFPDNPDFIPPSTIDQSGGTDTDIDGTSGAELILGGTGASFIEGFEGADFIFGGEPSADPSPLVDYDDFLFGGMGDDILVGGAGYDVYYIQRDGGDNLIVDGNTAVGGYSNGLVLFEGLDGAGGIEYTDAYGNDQGVTESDVQFVNNDDGTWTINFTTSTGSVTFASSEISDINLQNNEPGGTGGTSVFYTFDDNGTATDYTDDRYVSVDGDQDGDDGAGVIQTANGGYVSLAKDGSFNYHPADGFEGSDSFDYTITDPDGETDTATAHFTVNNDPFGLFGNDTIFGGEDAEYIDGSDGNDVIHGGGGNDFIVGGNGDDALYGEGGNDILRGGEGNDQFFSFDGDDLVDFHLDPGHDTVNAGFSFGAGTDDRLDVSEYGFTNFADLLDSTNDVGSDTVIDLSPDASVTLIGVAKADLHEDDFLL